MYKHPAARIVSFFILMLVLYPAGFGCQSAGDTPSDVDLSWEIEPNPPQVGSSTIHMVLKDSTMQPIEGAQLRLEGNMSHPGMKPVIVNAEEVEPGQYSAEMNFTMAGDWFIIVTASLNDSTEVEKQINVTGVRSQ